MLYNEYGIGTGIELTGIVPELDDWALFERWWDKFWRSTAGKVLGIGVLVAATVLAAVCPAFMPMYKAALVITELSLAIGGVIAGFRSVANGEPYWDGFSDYLNDNWSQTVALEMGTSMLLFGISSAANAVYKAWSARKAAQVAERELYSFELDPRSIELAKEGEPTFGTFRKRVWKNEAKFRPEKYNSKQLTNMIKGKAPIKEGYPMQLHHVRGKAVDMYDVVALTQQQHIQFHKAYKYKINANWNMENLIKMFGGIK